MKEIAEMSYEQYQRRLFALEDMLAAIEAKHGIGCSCETCQPIREEMRFIGKAIKERELK